VDGTERRTNCAPCEIFRDRCVTSRTRRLSFQKPAPGKALPSVRSNRSNEGERELHRRLHDGLDVRSGQGALAAVVNAIDVVGILVCTAESRTLASFACLHQVFTPVVREMADRVARGTIVMSLVDVTRGLPL
jgi:hypothetical protein